MKLRRILLLGMLGFSLALSAENKKIGYVQVSPDSSLADAVRKAREMRRLGQADSVVVKMQAGQYRLYEPLVLRPEDSHLCFEGTPSVKHSAGTVLTGAVPVTGWKKQGRFLVVIVYLVPWDRGIATTSLRTGLAMTGNLESARQTTIYRSLQMNTKG